MHTTARLGTSSDKGQLGSRVLSPRELLGIWPEIEELIEKALFFSQNEVIASDILEAALQETMAVFVTERNDEVESVCVVEVARFPQYTSLLIVALAGKNLHDTARFAPALQAYAFALGAVEIRAFCGNEAMVRLLRRLKLPFNNIYTVVSWNLRGKLQ